MSKFQTPICDELRADIEAKIKDYVEPLLDLGKYNGGYNCCGCSTYDWILEDCLAIVRGVTPAKHVL